MTVDPDEAERKIRESEAAGLALLAASNNAFETFKVGVSELDRSTMSTKQKGLIALVNHCQQTSEAVQLLRQSGFYIHAIGLLRTRLEEVIICSYLTHEPSDEVADRYFTYGPIASYLTAKRVLDDPYLAALVTPPNDVSTMYEQAANIERSFNPGFDIKGGKFSPKWTNLDLYSMAQRRDGLAEGKYPLVPPLKLGPLYNSSYKTGSAVLHADGSVLSSPFVGQLIGLDGVTRDVSRFWSMAIPGMLVAYDQLQCMEVLSFLLASYEG